MNVQKCDYPWTHWVIDEFLEPSDYSALLKWFDTQPERTYDERQELVADPFTIVYPKDIETPLHDSFVEVLTHGGFVNYGTITYQLFKMTPDELDEATHCDSPAKIASLVLYVGEENIGTFMHESNDTNPVKQIEWVENRAMLFFPEQGVTWHSYHNKGTKTPRCTALLNFRAEVLPRQA